MPDHERARKRRSRRRRATEPEHVTQINFDDNEGSHIVVDRGTGRRGAALAQYGHTLDDAAHSTWYAGDSRGQELDAVAGSAAGMAGELAATGGLFALEAAAGIASVIAMFAAMANTMGAADRQVELAAEATGVRLGLVAIDLLRLERNVPALTVPLLEQTIKSSPLTADVWNSQVTYAAASGPDRAAAGMRKGLGRVAEQVVRAVRSAIALQEEQSGRRVSGAERIEIRRVIYQQVAAAARERHADLKPEREQRKKERAER